MDFVTISILSVPNSSIKMEFHDVKSTRSKKAHAWATLEKQDGGPRTPLHHVTRWRLSSYTC
jgi:hypothetical protein